jgi:osmotically-inducible protein OsmY
MILHQLAAQLEPDRRHGVAELQHAVARSLVRDPRLGVRPKSPHLAFEHGTLELEGVVQSLAAKRRAVQLAALQPGVHSVRDRLRVMPSASRSDATICDHVASALLEEVAFCECVIRTWVDGVLGTVQEPVRSRGMIQVAVAGGVVTLDGALPTRAHERLAGVLAWWVPGTEDVIQAFGVLGAGADADDDDEITASVCTALEKDPFIARGQTQVQTQAKVVTLSGLVWSEQERRMAENDAWYVDGVADVVNALRVAEAA